MLELQHDTLNFSFPEVHPDATVGVAFQRTLRIPDDGKQYPLPPGLGHFPIKHTDDYKDRVPEKWLKRGGVMLPMFQSEALWISFKQGYSRDHGVPYPFAIKIAAGKRSAVTGRPWSQSLREKDYVIIPVQQWIDGYVVEEGVIRQFVAMPLGMGLTVEAQLSGKEEFGGIQVEVIPMKREHFERRFPKRPPPQYLGGGGILRSCGLPGVYASNISEGAADYAMNGVFACAAAPAADMGLGAGGQMKQQIFDDPYGIGEWHDSEKNRCYVHLANSLAWEAITRQKPPTTPVTAALYNTYGYPWFDHYRDDVKSLKATSKLGGIKSVLELGYQKGLQGGVLPENEPTTPKKVVSTTPKRSPSTVRDGTWK